MGVHVIDRELVAGGNMSLRIKLYPAIRNPYEDVGFTGMVDELERSAAHVTVDRTPLIDFDNGNELSPLGAASSFTNGNRFSRKFAQLGPGTDRGVREDAFALDDAFLND
jgi:hypothetical protein